MAEQPGVAGALRPNAIRVKSYLVSAKHADDSSGDVFLNSFYADDLERVADAVEAGQAGTALLDYLRDDADLDAALRCDVRGTPATALEHVQPASMPLGRWPADNDRPLVLSQVASPSEPCGYRAPGIVACCSCSALTSPRPRGTRKPRAPMFP
ncbi:hypothetical protein Sgleb_61180 [Streptomyces glebosus]|uniref:Uncharacterized protein n=1 Tax=Streptomyces glebosus TaxID=249580 RepID=A0A640T6C7_9ACTN|nr:hypothetical protein [Streptomyces glebosus]GFE18071.1 hypothetical protein Sgleb_61180 [Streptomyces glebosus]GHG46193.1 hypothetical protein GCM10010513_01820 [Streptomyces glebosus]